MGLATKYKSASQSKPDILDTPNNIEELKEKYGDLETENAVMKETLDILRVDPHASTALVKRECRGYRYNSRRAETADTSLDLVS